MFMIARYHGSCTAHVLAYAQGREAQRGGERDRAAAAAESQGASAAWLINVESEQSLKDPAWQKRRVLDVSWTSGRYRYQLLQFMLAHVSTVSDKQSFVQAPYALDS